MSINTNTTIVALAALVSQALGSHKDFEKKIKSVQLLSLERNCGLRMSDLPYPRKSLLQTLVNRNSYFQRNVLRA